MTQYFASVARILQAVSKGNQRESQHQGELRDIYEDEHALQCAKRLTLPGPARCAAVPRRR
jgi:hypothetical protein